MKYLVEIRKYRDLRAGDQIIETAVDETDDFNDPEVVVRIRQIVEVAPYSPPVRQNGGWVEILIADEGVFCAPNHYEALVILETIE